MELLHLPEPVLMNNEVNAMHGNYKRAYTLT